MPTAALSLGQCLTRRLSQQQFFRQDAAFSRPPNLLAARAAGFGVMANCTK
jgi:hypothetical protein